MKVMYSAQPEIKIKRITMQIRGSTLKIVSENYLI
jgi:hypothetical protein